MLRSGVRIPPGVFICMVDVAQLVRAPVCGSGGRGFESRLPPQKVIELKLRQLILEYLCCVV